MRKHLKKYFIPHQENNHRPHFLRDKSIKFILVVSLIAEIGILSFILPILPGKLDYLSAILPSVLVTSANSSRESSGLGGLQTNEKLELAAQLKANDMAEKGYFSHYTPDGKSPWYFVNLAGYSYEDAGENLAVNFIDSEDVHRAWMNSPTHRQNILRSEFSEVGIATAKGKYKGKDAIFVAQFFGKPKMAPTVLGASVKNDSPIDEVKTSVALNDVSVDQPTVFGVETTSEPLDDVKSVLDSSSKEELSTLDYVLAKPRAATSMIIYVFLGLAAVASLLSFFIKIKIQDKRILIHGFLIVLILMLLLFINTQIVEYFGVIGAQHI